LGAQLGARSMCLALGLADRNMIIRVEPTNGRRVFLLSHEIAAKSIRRSGLSISGIRK
jgi:hypothetical protein